MKFLKIILIAIMVFILANCSIEKTRGKSAGTGEKELKKTILRFKNLLRSDASGTPESAPKV